MGRVFCPMGIHPSFMDFLWSLPWLFVDHLGILTRVKHNARFSYKLLGWACAYNIGLLTYYFQHLMGFRQVAGNSFLILGILLMLALSKCYGRLLDILLRHWIIFSPLSC
ncbi:unnamed protein product [Prunus brigantina]